MQPDPRGRREFRACDPACGTGGFLVAAYEWLLERTGGGALDMDEVDRIREEVCHGQDLAARSPRLALMNLYLHGLRPVIYLGDSIYEPDRGERCDVVLTNPPFGSKGAGELAAVLDELNDIVLMVNQGDDANEEN